MRKWVGSGCVSDTKTGLTQLLMKCSGEEDNGLYGIIEKHTSR